MSHKKPVVRKSVDRKHSSDCLTKTLSEKGQTPFRIGSNRFGMNAAAKIRLSVMATAAIVISSLVVHYIRSSTESHPTNERPHLRSIIAGANIKGNSPDVQASVQLWKDLIKQNFSCDEACADCHREIYEAHLRSGHSHTATPMLASDLATTLLEVGFHQDRRRGQTFEFSQVDNLFHVIDVGNDHVAPLPVTWLLGSGQHAQTPISINELTQTGVELRWSHIAGDGLLSVTPDQDRFDSYQANTLQCFGRPMDASDIRACLGCHTTVGPPNSVPILDELYVPNVGCERCHGPRKKHVALARQGLPTTVPPLIQYKSAESYLDQCSQCHRDESTVSPGAKPHELVRFQPYGLKRSRCYQADPEKMTCSACHDPHDAVSHDRSAYIAQCQQCHQRGTGEQCPRAPGGDCITCHMPPLEWTSGISFHDHWIRIPSEQ